jgi:hypothetical protein
MQRLSCGMTLCVTTATDNGTKTATTEGEGGGEEEEING